MAVFDPQNSFWSAIGKFTDVLVLSLLWLFCSLPVFTIGAATAALYDSASRCVRGGSSGPWARFFRTFRQEFVTSTIVTVVWGAVLAALVMLLRLVWQAAAGGASTALAVACTVVFLLVPVGAACWMFPLLSRFTFRPVGLMAAGLRFAVGYLPYTAFIAAVAVAAALAGWLLWFPMLVLPCVAALLWSLPMERVFRKYIPQEDALPPGEEAE